VRRWRRRQPSGIETLELLNRSRDNVLHASLSRSGAATSSDEGIARAMSQPGARAMRIQYGALPYRFSASGALEILLITTRRTRRWVIPKGWPIKGLKPEKSAAREAFEEAGVRGAVGKRPIGAFTYAKMLQDDGRPVPCEVRVFALQVKRQSITWLEAAARETRWLAPADALEMIDEPGLRALIADFAGMSVAAAAE
jgi:8-oxo-dGTP pyrophosphatase MutT (NUDIX family)